LVGPIFRTHLEAKTKRRAIGELQNKLGTKKKTRKLKRQEVRSGEKGKRKLSQENKNSREGGVAGAPWVEKKKDSARNNIWKKNYHG